ncbi:MAG TPA: sugar phosphate isomerase/epimerase family protein [Verrucomicrobiae bacterium]
MSKLSRREFIGRTLAASASIPLCAGSALSGLAAETFSPPIVVFSKVYQTLKLNFDEAAALTAEAAIDGIDCPVRPGGEVLPEHVARQLPEYAAALRKRGLQLPLLTTAITGVSSPCAEDILRTAKKLGVQFYRLGFVIRETNASAGKQVREIKAQLKDLAALNKQIGIGAIFQNHSPAGQTYVGGDLAELYDIVKDFDPAQIGVAFDIGHALVVHGDDWRRHFEKLKPHLKIAYVKDVKREGRWVPFGEGDIGSTGYFKLLKELKYQAPVSLHIEFDWTDGGKSKTRPALVKALQDSSRVLRRWLASA